MAKGQDVGIEKIFFKRRDFGHYFYSDRYAPITNIGIGVNLLISEYDIALSKRAWSIVSEPRLGAQLPIYYNKK
jgi:hypothetical protein